ncbi:hypothetical protein TPY_2411 [Sulfobacillus acidophilus TPY]|nr:hypothetical protein TPY_2411 [Sulfobacillus acidophilus TPY]
MCQKNPPHKNFDYAVSIPVRASNSFFRIENFVEKTRVSPQATPVNRILHSDSQ